MSGHVLAQVIGHARGHDDQRSQRPGDIAGMAADDPPSTVPREGGEHYSGSPVLYYAPPIGSAGISAPVFDPARFKLRSKRLLRYSRWKRIRAGRRRWLPIGPVQGLFLFRSASADDAADVLPPSDATTF